MSAEISHRRTLITAKSLAVVLTFMLIGACTTGWTDAPPAVFREVQPGKNSLALKQTFLFPAAYYGMGADSSGIFYRHAPTNGLFAFDTHQGKILWRYSQCINPGGMENLIDVLPVLYMTTSLGIYACDAATGEYLWSARLGDGHVKVIPQLDPQTGTLRVYYGDRIFELDPASGAILSDQPKGDVAWKVGRIEIRYTPSTGIEGWNSASGEKIWKNPTGPFEIYSPDLIPLQINATSIFITSNWNKVCVFDLTQGTYTWCDTAWYISNLGFRWGMNTGYILRDDFVLVELDLQTGATLSETPFSPSRLPEDDLYVHHYFTSVTDDTVLVYFGDSRQLFVLER